MRQLDINGATTVNLGSYRDNLIYEVRRTVNEAEKDRRLMELLAVPGRTWAVATIREAKALFERLRQTGLPVGLYHGKVSVKIDIGHSRVLWRIDFDWWWRRKPSDLESINGTCASSSTTPCRTQSKVMCKKRDGPGKMVTLPGPSCCTDWKTGECKRTFWEASIPGERIAPMSIEYWLKSSGRQQGTDTQ